jgi:uncharacterized protein (DUF849 family)
MADLAIMVAPNGARKGHAEHSNLPITIEETVKDALECQVAGAQAIHLHVRDDQGKHTLDSSRYIAATDAVRKAAGLDFPIQITTEAVGMFKPHEQIAVVKAVKPEAVSIATKELIPDASAEAAGAELYRWAYDNKIAVQHIVYVPNEFDHLLDLMKRGIVPGERHSVIFPLGRYASDQESDPAELVPFVARVQDNGGAARFDWWTCAFGASETASLVATAALGGHCRIGFENSFINSDGGRAASNAERIKDLRAGLHGIHRPPASRADIMRALGRPD